jgi:hypothetical protein
MGYQQVSDAWDNLGTALKPVVLASSDSDETCIDRLIEAIQGLIDARVEDALDREFNRGDYRY